MNIIPLIAKADTISKTELQQFKVNIMSELVSSRLQIYQFPTDDESIANINANMNVSTSLQILECKYFNGISPYFWQVWWSFM